MVVPIQLRKAIRKVKNGFQPDEIEILAIAIGKALQQARSVSDSEHYDHHRWISEKIKVEQLRAQFWRQMVEHMMKWGALSAISAIMYATWLWIKSEIHK